MGVYLNPKNKGFMDATRSEIYVDKTGLIAFPGTGDKSCLERPALCGACLYDRDPAGEEVRRTLSAEYVQGILHD